jgi:hypothetical protein
MDLRVLVNPSEQRFEPVLKRRPQEGQVHLLGRDFTRGPELIVEFIALKE